MRFGENIHTTRSRHRAFPTLTTKHPVSVSRFDLLAPACGQYQVYFADISRHPIPRTRRARVSQFNSMMIAAVSLTLELLIRSAQSEQRPPTP